MLKIIIKPFKNDNVDISFFFPNMTEEEKRQSRTIFRPKSDEYVFGIFRNLDDFIDALKNNKI